MRVLLVAPLVLFATAMASCQLQPTQPGGVSEARATPAAAASLRNAFLGEKDLAEILQRLGELETQAMQIAEDEPLKLGAIGTAILDICQGSLTGHYALHRFYEHLESPAAAASHAAWMDAVKTHMVGRGAGTSAEPYAALTPVEAQVFMISDSLVPVGTIYQSSESADFAMLVVGRPREGPLQNLYFDLSALYQTTLDTLAGQSGNHAEDIGFSPLTLMGMLARSGDTTAQAAVGALLLARRQYDDAIGWLRTASRTGNILANVMLARIFWEKSELAESEEDRSRALDQVMENYLHAIALGSSDAMYALGSLYIAGRFGEDNVASGLPLLEQAGELNHSNSLLYLAHLYYAGELVEPDLARAEDCFVRSAALDNRRARLDYAEYLVREGPRTAADGRALQWLEELVDEHDDAQAMVLLGSLHARGIAARQNFRVAHRWYRDALRTAPDNADIVNEVAWTLTVSDLDRLRRERYALKIMTRMMEADETARGSPEFLDTWAAAFAANGDFEEAVRLQQLALQKETSAAEREDILDILKQHLDLFRARKTVVEQAP